MAQNDWQDMLVALVNRSGGSLQGNGSDVAAAPGGPVGTPGAPAAGPESQAGSAGTAADLTERIR